MASSDQQNANKPRSTPTDDMRFVVDVLGHSIFNPMEVLTAVGPTLSELTCGLLGHRFRPERDIPDLSGKTIFVTGGNTGLGKETILQLGRHNPARIYLAARNEEKAKNAIQSIKADLSSSAVDVDIQFVQLDLSSFPSIRKAAETFTKNNSRLDILVLNAGVMGEAPVTTPQGHEIQFGTNHIGHFLLTKLLLPTLLQTASTTSEVRVVVVASIASIHTLRHPDYMDLVSTPQTLLDLSTWQRYAVSKAANILFAAEFARRFPSITCVSAHPGVVSSDLYNSTQATNRIVGPMLPALKLLFRTVRSGTLNQLWAAAGARKADLLSGAYYTSVGHENPHNRFVVDRELGKKLWDWTDREVERV